ncbi:MAG TPA: serine hydrolase [Phnomibacter sp.]|nr:serine hydrolase [Phnomibacter sp.]
MKAGTVSLRAFFIFLSFSFLACDAPDTNKRKADRMDEFLAGQMKYYRFNGNVLVAENGKIIFQKSYGVADFNTERPLNDSSVFELASVSKQFTATAILLLVDKGILKLTDTLRQFFPELPYPNITLWHMLTHTSGLPDYFEPMLEKWDKTKIAFNSDMIAFLAKEKLPVEFAPGTQWAYSNTAYALLASIVEKVSGQSYKDYMAENIFTPLGMRHTRIWNTRRSLRDTIPNYAFGYVYNDSLKKYILPDNDPNVNFVIFMDGIQGDGIVNSTAVDLLIWDRAIKNSTLLKPATQAEMVKGQSLMDTLKGSYYGFGVMLDSSDMGELLSHSGGWPGYTTWLARNIKKDQTVIVLSNNNAAAPSIGDALHHIMNGKPVELPFEQKEISIDSLTLEPLVGSYKGDRAFTIERKGDTLMMVMANRPPMKLKALSPTKFFFNAATDQQIEFVMGDSGKVSHFSIIRSGVRTEYRHTKDQ